jgi:hypothetical protein
MMNEVAEEEKEMEAKDAQVAKQILREEKDAILAERIMESERMAMAAQAKIEEDDFQKARLLHEEMVGERKREEGEMEGRDRMVARSYVRAERDEEVSFCAGSGRAGGVEGARAKRAQRV